MQTTMWTKQHRPPFGDDRRTWHLAPVIDRENLGPELESGFISSLIWQEGFQHPVTITDEQSPKPQVVESPARVYSILTGLLLIGVALLVLIVLRQH
jgi:hypothetical protein